MITRAIEVTFVNELTIMTSKVILLDYILKSSIKENNVLSNNTFSFKTVVYPTLGSTFGKKLCDYKIRIL